MRHKTNTERNEFMTRLNQKWLHRLLLMAILGLLGKQALVLQRLDRETAVQPASTRPPLESKVFDGVHSRPFPTWQQSRGSIPLPCFDPTDGLDLNWNDKRRIQKKPASQGLFYLKLLKTASSTAASVHLRIAHNLARNHPYPICRVRYLHGWAGPRMFHYNDRDRAASWLWTLVRDPKARLLSEFYHFDVSRQNQTDFRTFLRTNKHMDHHSLSWLSPTGYRFGKSRPIPTANAILKDYDFIGVTERFDESIVVLMLLLDLTLADILYVTAKASGGWDDGEFQNRCFHILPTVKTPEMTAYFNSFEWQVYARPEIALHQAANHSLDLTIAQLGRPRVERLVQQLRRAGTIVNERCRHVRLPCSSTGEKREETDCLSADMGCGFECLDQVATELGLWTKPA